MAGVVGGSNDDDYVMLRPYQLELLAVTLRNREERMIHTKSFDTEEDRVNYLNSVNRAYEQTMDLFRANARLKQRCSAMEDINKRSKASPIVDDIHEYIEVAIDMSLQGFRNCAVRSNFLSKVKTHFNALAKAVESDDFAVEEEGVLKLIEEAKAAKEAMWMSANRYRSPFARACTEGYRIMIKQEGQTVADVIKSQQNKLGLEGEFESLEEKEQILVYKGIVEESFGETYGFFDKVAMVGGPAVILATLGLMAYDVVTADDKTEAVLRNSLNLLSIGGGFLVQVAVDMAATEVFTAMGLGAVVVPLGALVLSVAAGYIFSVGAGHLIDQVIHGGGKAPKLDGLTFHKITMPPDGKEIAREIARGGYS